jgi:hypothetical protein
MSERNRLACVSGCGRVIRDDEWPGGASLEHYVLRYGPYLTCPDCATSEFDTWVMTLGGEPKAPPEARSGGG